MNSVPNTDLAEQLEALVRDERFVVRRVLKRTDFECTEKVMFREDDGTLSGPYIRKRFTRMDGVGSAYARLYAASKASIAFEHLPRILDVHDAGDQCVVVMQFMEGETLEQVVDRCGASPELVVDVGIRLCEAVGELHSLFNPPIIHRDLKPSNIMLARDQLYLIDFGIARSYDDGAVRDTACFGTRGFAPPEQFGFGQTDVRSDIYSLGAVMAYCALGPNTAPRDVSDGGMPACLREIVSKATSLDPAMRYESAAEISRALVQAARKLGISPSDAASARANGIAGEQLARLAGAQIHDDASPCGRHPATSPSPIRGISRLIASVPLWVGIAWNMVLGSVFLLFIGAFCSLLANPDPSAFAADGPWEYRFICYGALIFLGIGPLLALVSDRRLLHRRFPRVFRPGYAAESLVLVGVVVASLVIIIATASAYSLVA